MTTNTELKPAMLPAPVLDVDKRGKKEFMIVQLMVDGTRRDVVRGGSSRTAAWSKLGFMVAQAQRQVPAPEATMA